MNSVIAITTIRTAKDAASTEGRRHHRIDVHRAPRQEYYDADPEWNDRPDRAHVHGHDGAQAVAPEVPFDYRQEGVLITGDSMDFEAAARDLAFEKSPLR